MEDELRKLLQEASTPIDGRDHHEVLRSAQAEADRRRAKRSTFITTATASGIAAAVAFFCAIALVGPHSSQQSNDLADGGPEVEINLSAHHEDLQPAAPTQLSSSRPGTIVAASTAGRLVTIDPQTGNTQNVLTTQSNPTDPKHGLLLGHVSASRSSGTIFFDQHASAATNMSLCDNQVKSVSINGGNVSTVTRGYAPAVSPDGKALAYVKISEGGGCHAVAVIMRSISSGAERTLFVVPTTSPVANIASIAWSRDGSQLAIDARDDTNQGLFVGVISSGSTTQPTVDELRKVPMPSSVQSGSTWSSPQFLADGQLFVSETCCGKTDTTSRMLIVDPLGKRAPGVVAIGFADRAHDSNAVAPVGHFIAYLSGEDLMMSDNFGRPAPISFGLLGITWF